MGMFKRSKTDSSSATAVTDPAVVSIDQAAARTPVRIKGQITRMRARPTDGLPALAVSVADGTGTVTAVWTGRRSIGGVSLGRTVVIEGVAVQRGDHLEFTNPAYTLCR
ncbi:MAG: DNA-binding protein [Ilumatobacteraceae bacterium]|nr:DNA-binding protein [Ilumatobacteraceae bacterium]